MKMRHLPFLFLILISMPVLSQGQPRLVVGIMVDQMRQDYLYRFSEKYGEGGFKRLMRDGFMMTNAHYNYVPTETGPGHASVYTGTTPAVHGIVGNDWYDRSLGQNVNCVGDDEYSVVGSEEGSGMVSPHRLLSTTITDELKMATQQRAKVIGVSIKDRGAVLPGGHVADAAYWYDSRSGNFITSTFYKVTMPSWAEAFNQGKKADQYLAQDWNTLLPIAQYTESGEDDNEYENKFAGKERPTFPYTQTTSRGPGYGLLSSSPFGNDLTNDFAMAALVGEQMGKDDITDFLAISYSSTDYVGHSAGPNSKEIEDTYIRLDKTIETLLNKLDEEVGEGRYTLFLTADHGVVDVPSYLRDLNIPAGNLDARALSEGLKEHLDTYFPGMDIIGQMSGDQIYLNHEAFGDEPMSSGVDMLVAIEIITNYLLKAEGIAQVYPASNLRLAAYDEAGMRGIVARGFYPKRSGDLAIVLEPGWYASGRLTGTGHGSAYTYDTHVPMIFYGEGIKSGTSAQYHPVTDIAPTLSVLLKIKFPSGATGQPITEILD